MLTNRPARAVFFFGLLAAVSAAACAPAASPSPAPAAVSPTSGETPAVATAPVLERVFPRSVLPGGPFQLYGSGFGERPTDGRVTLRGAPVEVLAWEDSHVRARAPRDAAPGESTVAVAVAGRRSNEVALLIKDPVIAPHTREIPCHRDTVLCSIYLPPQYDAEPARRFPVIYHFQGRMWGNRMIPEQSNFVTIAGAYGFIVVFDWPLRAKEDLPELVKEIDAAYRTIPHPEARGVWLTSASGQLGLQAASERPDLIGAVDGSHACLGSFDPEGARRLRLRLDIGIEDDTCGPAFQRARAALLAQNIPFEYEEHPGAHEAGTMFGDSTIRGVLEFFARTLRTS